MKALVLRAEPVKGTKKLLAGIEFLTGLGTKKHIIHHTVLRRFISQEGTPAGDLLRSCLIVIVGYRAGKKSKTYRVDSEKLMALRGKYFNEELPDVLVHPESKHEYLATVKLNPFRSGIPREVGTRSGYRWYNEVTSMRSEVRAALIGHGFDYDISASMATLLYQQYLKTGADPLPTWAKLVTNKSLFRAELSLFTGLPLGTIKKICASILNGGQVVRHKENSVWKEFRSWPARCTFDEFKEHEHIQGLLKEGRVLYETLVPSQARTRVKKTNKSGKEVLRAKSRGWHQYHLYERIEDEVMSVVSVVVGSEDTWFIHDGFMTRTELTDETLTSIIKQVEQETGYVIDLEKTELRDYGTSRQRPGQE